MGYTVKRQSKWRNKPLTVQCPFYRIKGKDKKWIRPKKDQFDFKAGSKITKVEVTKDYYRLQTKGSKHRSRVYQCMIEPETWDKIVAAGKVTVHAHNPKFVEEWDTFVATEDYTFQTQEEIRKWNDVEDVRRTYKTVTFNKGAKIQKKKVCLELWNSPTATYVDGWLIQNMWRSAKARKRKWQWEVTDEQWRDALRTGKIQPMPRYSLKAQDDQVEGVPNLDWQEEKTQYQDEGMQAPSAPELPQVTPM